MGSIDSDTRFSTGRTEEMSTEAMVAVVFFVVLVMMAGAAYSYFLLEQEAKKSEAQKNVKADDGQ